MQKYIPSETNLDAKEDNFLLNNIEKDGENYKVEILEYILDFSEADTQETEDITENKDFEYNVLIENLDGEVIQTVKNTDSKTYITEVIKNNIEKFGKKELTIKRNDNNILEIISVKSK